MELIEEMKEHVAARQRNLERLWATIELADQAVHEAVRLLNLSEKNLPAPRRWMAEFLENPAAWERSKVENVVIKSQNGAETAAVAPADPDPDPDPEPPAQMFPTPAEPAEAEADQAAEPPADQADQEQRNIRTGDVVNMLQIYGKHSKGITAEKIVERMRGMQRCRHIDLGPRAVNRTTVIMCNLLASKRRRGQIERVSKGHYRWLAK